MNYEMFKEIVSEKLADYLPDEYKHRQLSFGTFDKINTKRDGVTFMGKDGDPKVSPTMYLDGLYEDYKKVGDVDIVLQTAAQGLCKHLEQGLHYVVTTYFSFLSMKSKIVNICRIVRIANLTTWRLYMIISLKSGMKVF